MQFPPSFNTFTIPTGAQPGTSRIFVDSSGHLFSFGNPPDVATANFVEIGNGSIQLGPQTVSNTADTAHASLLIYDTQVDFSSNVIPALDIFSPSSATHTFFAEMSLLAGTGNTPATAPLLKMINSAGSVNMWASVSGGIVRTNTGGDTIASWQTPSYNANWADNTSLNGNAGFGALRFRQTIQDDIWIKGSAVASGAGGSIFTMPAGYIPTNRQLVPSWFLQGATITTGWVQITQTGVVNVASTLANITVAAGTVCYINGHYSLGNITGE